MRKHSSLKPGTQTGRQEIYRF